jgi:hypothetical protein
MELEAVESAPPPAENGLHGNVLTVAAVSLVLFIGSNFLGSINTIPSDPISAIGLQIAFRRPLDLTGRGDGDDAPDGRNDDPSPDAVRSTAL